MRRIKKTTELLSVLLVIILLLLLCSCSASNSFTAIEISSSVSFEGSGNSYRVFDKMNTEKIASSDSVELYCHKKSGGISVKSLNTGKDWTSLPSFQNSFASSFVATVFYKNKLY